MVLNDYGEYSNVSISEYEVLATNETVEPLLLMQSDFISEKSAEENILANIAWVFTK